MKMITAIINKTDADMVCESLRYAGFSFTKIASTGGFLSAGSMTILLGTEDDQLEKAMDIIRRNCRKRTAPMPSAMQGYLGRPFAPATASVPVGGATVFVYTVDHFEKM